MVIQINFPVNDDPICALATVVQFLLGDQCNIDLGQWYKEMVEKGHMTEIKAVAHLKYHLARLIECRGTPGLS